MGLRLKSRPGPWWKVCLGQSLVVPLRGVVTLLGEGQTLGRVVVRWVMAQAWVQLLVVDLVESLARDLAEEVEVEILGLAQHLALQIGQLRTAIVGVVFPPAVLAGKDLVG